MRLSFRRRIFLGLVVLGTVPLTTALIVLAVQVRSTGSSIGPRAALDDVTESGRAMMAALDTTQLSDTARAALRQHTQTIATGTNLARRAETLSRFAAGILATLILIAAAVLVTASLQLARRWSAYFSAPIDELVRWVGLIRRRQYLPKPTDGNTAPEFDALRAALREMSEALETARRREVERERLIAFREIARRVAHEIRGPLTSSRLALAQLEKSGATSQSPRTAEIEVLQEELGRLDRLAREFSEFGRLPEGPEAPVDIGELLDSVVPATVPETVPVHRQTDGELVVQGHYEPLRRAVQNLLRNAVEATSGRGIEVKASRTGDRGTGTIRLSIADHGLGVPSSQRDQIFEPYFTTKATGTGLGLAIVKQTIAAHGGTIAVEDTLDGGATFVMELPERS